MIKLNNWLNNEMPKVTKVLEEINQDNFFRNKTIGFAGKENVYKVLHNLRSALFPGVYEKYPIDESKVNILIGNNIRTAAIELSDLIEKVFINRCKIEERTSKKLVESAKITPMKLPFNSFKCYLQSVKD